MLSPALVTLQALITTLDQSLLLDWPMTLLQRAPALAITTTNLLALLPLQPSLSAVTVAGADLAYLKPLLAMTVEFRIAQATDHAWASLVRDFGRRCPRLRELQVRVPAGVTQAPIQPLLDLDTQPALRYLTLQYGMYLDALSMNKLRAWLEHGTARGLRLLDVKVNDADGRALCNAVAASSSLLELRLVRVLYPSVHLLGRLPLPPSLRVLVWQATTTALVPPPLLPALCNAPQLHTLNLSGSRVLCPNAIAELLPHLPRLRTLDLSRSRFEPPGDVVQLIAAMGQRPSLQHVSMRQCKLPQSTIPPLVACIPAWPSLQRLDLVGVSIRAPDLCAMLMALGRCPNFAFLSLRFPPYTDAMWRAIVPALGAGLLKWQRVAFSECEPTAVQVLQLLRRLLEHNEQAFTGTCGKGYWANALQAEYSRLLNELGLLAPTRESCVLAFMHLE